MNLEKPVVKSYGSLVNITLNKSSTPRDGGPYNRGRKGDRGS